MPFATCFHPPHFPHAASWHKRSASYRQIVRTCRDCQPTHNATCTTHINSAQHHPCPSNHKTPRWFNDNCAAPSINWAPAYGSRSLSCRRFLQSSHSQHHTRVFETLRICSKTDVHCKHWGALPTIYECQENIGIRSATKTFEVQRKSRSYLQRRNSPEDNNLLDTVATIHCNPIKSCTTQATQHTTVCREVNKQLTQNWIVKTSLASKYKNSCERYCKTLFKF